MTPKCRIYGCENKPEGNFPCCCPSHGFLLKSILHSVKNGQTEYWAGYGSVRPGRLTKEEINYYRAFLANNGPVGKEQHAE